MLQLSQLTLNSNSTIGDLPCYEFQVSPTTSGREVAHKFEQDPDLPGVLIIQAEGLGLISRQKFYWRLSRPFGLELFMRHPIQDLLDVTRQEYLTLPHDCRIDAAVQVALSRATELVYEPVVVELADNSLVLLNVYTLLLAQTQLLSMANKLVQEQKDLAESANLAKSQFLANMSHELRTPLNAIIGYSELMEEEVLELGPAGLGLLPDLQRINGAGKHLLGLINDILDLSKIEAGKMDLYLEVFDLNIMISDVINIIHPLIERRKNRLVVDCPPQQGSMMADLTKVRQSLFNLLSNAAKFTENGTITLSLRHETGPDTNQVIIRVSDTGIGMSQAQLDKVFQPFTQADSSTSRKYGGTGLGLAITHNFCVMMGGNITVESQPELGSSFTITLPARVIDPKSKSEPPPLSGPDIQSKRPRPHTTGKNTVLVIDDDPTVGHLIKGFLSNEGFEVEYASGGEEGLRMARLLQPLAITLDVMMPGLDGWAVLTALKNDPELDDIPVIVLTFVDNNKELGYSLGAVDYLSKPIDRHRLTNILKRYWQDRNMQSVLVVEDDPATREIVCRLIEREGMQVYEAENGRVALERLAQAQPELILLDLMMPEMDGFDFVTELRRHIEWRNIPIVVITAKDITNEDRLRLNGYVEKILQKGSYNQKDLLLEVRNLVASATTGPRQTAGHLI